MTAQRQSRPNLHVGVDLRPAQREFTKLPSTTFMPNEGNGEGFPMRAVACGFGWA
jgi:hypothetical protein